MQFVLIIALLVGCANSLSFYSIRSDFALAGGDVTGAQALLQQRLIDYPEDAIAAYNLGQSYYETGDFARAVPYFEAVGVQESAERSLRLQAYYQAGNALVKQQNYSSALAAYESVVGLQADHAQALKMIEALKKLLEQEKDKQDQSDQKNKTDSSSSEKNSQREPSDSDNNSDSSEGDSDEQKDREGQGQANQNSGKEKSEGNGEKNDKNGENNSGENKKTNANPNEQKNNKQAEGKRSGANGLTQDKAALERELKNAGKHEQLRGGEQESQEEGGVAPAPRGSDSKASSAHLSAGSGSEVKKEKKENDDKVNLLLQMVEGHDNAVAKRLLQSGVGQGSSSKVGYKNW